MISEQRRQELLAKISTQEAQLAEMKAELNERAQPKAPPKQEDGVRIYTLAPTLPEMPSDEELTKLLGIVLKHYPALAPHETRRDEFSDDFRKAFVHIAGLQRAEKPDASRWVSAFIDHMAVQCGVTVRGGAYIAAALAQGDVPFIASSMGQSWELGIKLYGGGRRAIAAWRNVLRGELLKPAVSERPFTVPIAPQQLLVR